MKKCTVFYQDIENIWCPLTHLYFSQSSFTLLSKYPTEISEEIISSYCPQCLTRYQEDEPTNQFHPTLTQSLYGYCPTCYQCTECYGVMLKFQEETKNNNTFNESNQNEPFLLVCTNCRQKVTVNLSTVKKECEKQNQYFQTLLNFYSNQAASVSSLSPAAAAVGALSSGEDWRKGNASKSLYRSNFPLPSTARVKTWHIEDVEAVIASKQFTNSNFTIPFEHADDETLISEDTIAPPILGKKGYQNFPLLNKRTLRNRKDLEQGKMNILIQPKLLPLEGDSSTKFNKGKWWVKDSSAIQFLPVIQVLSLRLDPLPNLSYVILKITNPNEFPTTLTLHSYPSERLGNDYEIKLAPENRFITFQLQQYWSIESSIQQYSVDLDAYEDELLKDEIEEESDLATIIQKLRPVKEKEASASEFQANVQGNTVYLRVPLSYFNAEEAKLFPQETRNLPAPLLFSLRWAVQQGNLLSLSTMIEFS